MSEPRPFFPPNFPIPQQVVTEDGLMCCLCHKVIAIGEKGWILSGGYVGYGPKSGQPMIIEPVESEEMYFLHPYCIRAQSGAEICEEEEDIRMCTECSGELGDLPENLCMACGVELE